MSSEQAKQTDATYPGPAELFASDIHGENEAFAHVLRTACGRIRPAIDDALGDRLTPSEKDQLESLIAYPLIRTNLDPAHAKYDSSWAMDAASNLVKVYRFMGGVPERGMAQAMFANPTGVLKALSFSIQALAVSKIHLLGDIYDRGPQPDLIMEEIMARPNLDIQWGNHDILWMGAALGQRGCVANVVRICARYGNLSVLEDNYGMDLSALRAFAATAYADDPCVAFGLKGNPDLSEEAYAQTVKIQKAMAIIQFKVEAQIIADNPSFGLEKRNLLHKIDREAGTVEIQGERYEIIDTVLPTVDAANPYALTADEEQVMCALEQAFLNCAHLQRHIGFMLEKGSLYTIAGDKLLFHACVPLNADGSLMDVELFGQTLSGKALFDTIEQHVRNAFTGEDQATRKQDADLIWYLWLGQGSPLFAKSKMATFELYFCTDKAIRKELKNPFYALIEAASTAETVLANFGMDPANSMIICGHNPVKVKDGEDPVKCNGKIVDIDGGFSRAYQPTTGLAGMVLIDDEHQLALASLKPFSTQAYLNEDAPFEFDLRVLKDYRA